jgi:hypothetical protein
MRTSVHPGGIRMRAERSERARRVLGLVVAAFVFTAPTAASASTFDAGPVGDWIAAAESWLGCVVDTGTSWFRPAVSTYENALQEQSDPTTPGAPQGADLGEQGSTRTTELGEQGSTYFTLMQ